MVNHKVCYVCCFYLGDRRNSTNRYNLDRSSYLKEQIKSLSEFEHHLDMIIFVFNLDESHLEYFNEIKNQIPDFIKQTKVDVVCRENVGLSYGAWSEVFSLYKSRFDYYIFNEDDYFINDHNFDSYLVRKFNSYNNIGYLAGMITNPFPQNPLKKPHAGNSFGISSFEVLDKLYTKCGFLPHDREKRTNEGDRYKSGEESGQVSQTYEIFNLGYNLFDVREDYSTPHEMGRSKTEIDSDHIIENFFSWNSKSLIVPASMRFNEGFYVINIIDPQYQKKRSCYIINFYFGHRRKTIDEYKKDPLCFLKKQIESLSKFYHNLDRIIFSINIEKEHYGYLNEALNIIPKYIQNSYVEIVIRENKGFSYGAFSDFFKKNQDEFDYFIFNEDDYFTVENNWDEYLIRKYNSLPDSGYLCAIKRDKDQWNNNREYAGHLFGISSRSSLIRILDENGNLSYDETKNDYSTQEEIQIQFTNRFTEHGLKIYDIREEYRVSFAMPYDVISGGVPVKSDIWRWFWWNERDLIVPSIILFDYPYTWYESFDDPCVRKRNI